MVLIAPGYINYFVCKFHLKSGRTNYIINRMVLIDALHINNGGGLSLLRVLVNAIEDAKLDAYYLLDVRAEKHFLSIPSERKFVSNPGVINRLKFYRQHSGNFDTIFCFANLPPLKRYN